MREGAASGVRVVVCEDDEPTLENLIDHLAADRFEPLPAPTAQDARRLCRHMQPGLLLLDLGLPDASGLDLLREIRASEGVAASYDADLPVIVLSGRSSTTDRVRGLAAGADDYLVKPFRYAELAARIDAVLRRGRRSTSGAVRVGELVVDTATRRVSVGGREVRLANKELALLRVLASEPGRVFTKEELLRDVWGFRTPGRTRTVDSHASRLRRKLDPEGARYVINCWGVGYRLIETVGEAWGSP